MKNLKFSDKNIIKRTEAEPFVTVRLFYPFCDDESKAAKRINRLVHNVISSYAEKALSSDQPLFLRHELKYKIIYNAEDAVCIFFELEKYGADGLYNYRPFSISFDNNGFPMPAPYSHSYALYSRMKKAFAARGIRLCKKQFLYSFLLCEDGAVIYAPKPDGTRGRRGGVVRLEVIE